MSRESMQRLKNKQNEATKLLKQFIEYTGNKADIVIPSWFPANDVQSLLQVIQEKNKKIEILIRMLEEAGIATSDSEITINSESILNQVSLKLGIANNYEELVEKYTQLESQLEVCKAGLVARQEEYVEL